MSPTTSGSVGPRKIDQLSLARERWDNLWNQPKSKLQTHISSSYNPISLEQTQLDGSHHSAEFYGDKMRRKTDATLRIGFQNIDGLPMDGKRSKSSRFIGEIISRDIDVMCSAEVGHYKRYTSRWHGYGRDRRSHSSFARFRS